jgi:glycine/D-amino acid oxidase-like deaminating enzyme
MSTDDHRYRGLSLWLDTFDGDLTPRAPLVGDLSADVAIVGGGFTGLWTAYYLAERDPSLSIAIVERDICGFGASGRNGGWCEGELAAGFDRYARLSSPDQAMRLYRAMFAAVDEVGRVADAEGFDCGFAKGGATYVARNGAQAKRQRELIEAERAHGFGEDVVRLLSADEARASVNATAVRSGIHFAPTAALNPVRLVRGLVDAVERRGVRIYEQSAATAIRSGRVDVVSGSGSSVEPGSISAPVVIRATEGYTGSLAGERRTFAPIYSLMIATEPLDPGLFDEIGLADRETFADDRYAVIYGQRTDDDRLAFGGRGVPYLYGSRIDPATERHGHSHQLIWQTLLELFPVLADTEITHRWGGVMAAPRNWTPSVQFDRVTGLGTAGGYVGEGVCATNLAGRTLADLITGTASDLVDLPWVGARSRRWEPEPARWIGIRGTRAVMERADRVENRTDRESKLGLLASRLL